MGRRRYGRITVETSKEEKVLFPEAGVTKGQLVDYYESVWPRLALHLRARPLVLERFPDGVAAEGFYQKQVPDYFPDWIDRVRVGTRGGSQDLVVCDRKATLAYLANQAVVTLHPWLSRRDRLDCPDQLVLDLDPPEGGDFEAVRDAAFRARELLDALGLPSFPKTTGSKGLHLVVPLDRGARFDRVRAFARAAVELLARRHPDALTTEQRKAKRRGRLYLDVGRNAWGQTAVAPYAVRALPEAPVAAPLRWEELRSRRIHARSWNVRNLPRRLAAASGDPWSGWRRRARSLDAARRALDRLRRDED